MVLVSGLDLSTGKSGRLARAEGGLLRGVVQMQVCPHSPETDPTFARFSSLPCTHLMYAPQIRTSNCNMP